MQLKINRAIVRVGSEEKSHTDVVGIKGEFGLYVEYEDKIGTDNEGNDLTQKKLVMYPWEKVELLEWSENTLIEQVKELVILSQLEDLLEELEGYGDEDEEETPTPAATPDSKASNPYE